MFPSIPFRSTPRAEANRANAQKSTGPRTEAGKAASSKNALKEGFTASFAIVLPEEQSLYDAFLTGCRDELRPEGILEEDLFRRITLAAWNLRRIERLQQKLYTETGVDPLESDNPEVTAKLEHYARHQVLNERSYHRALKELRLLQDNRIAAAQLAKTLPADIPPLADAEAVSQRSRILPQRVGRALEMVLEAHMRQDDAVCEQSARRARGEVNRAA